MFDLKAKIILVLKNFFKYIYILPIVFLSIAMSYHYYFPPSNNKLIAKCYENMKDIQLYYLDCKNKHECEKYKIVLQQYKCEKLAETLKK